MTIAVVENPSPVYTNWSRPPGGNNGIPRRLAVFQGVQVAIPAATAEAITISINAGLPIGYAYKMVDARVLIEMSDTTGSNEFTQSATGQLQAYNSSSPTDTPVIPFRLDSSIGRTAPTSSQIPFNYSSDASSLPWKVFYESNNLPGRILTAETGTTVCQVNCSSTSTTSAIGALGYYLSFLVFDISDDQAWRLHTPVTVIG